MTLPTCLVLNEDLEITDALPYFMTGRTLTPILQYYGENIYKTKKWPTSPLFYVSATSVTDKDSAPAGCENLFFLIPVATGLTNDSEDLRESYFEMIVERFEKHIGESIRQNIIVKKSFAQQDFVNDYNAFKGNAYGLANTLLQTAILKPSIRSKKVKNLFFCFMSKIWN